MAACVQERVGMYLSYYICLQVVFLFCGYINIMHSSNALDLLDRAVAASCNVVLRADAAFHVIEATFGTC